MLLCVERTYLGEDHVLIPITSLLLDPKMGKGMNSPCFFCHPIYKLSFSCDRVLLKLKEHLFYVLWALKCLGEKLRLQSGVHNSKLSKLGEHPLYSKELMNCIGIHVPLALTYVFQCS